MKLPGPSPSPVPVFAALRAALPRWLRLGVSQWVADTISGGVKLDWASQPTPFRSAEYPLTAADAAFMATEIDRELRSGYILEVTDRQEIAALVCVSSAFVVHTAGKPRKVLDNKHPNSFISRPSCKYETLPELAQSLRPFDALLSWDVKDAYHHLMLRPTDRPYLTFWCLGRFFVPVTMPFRLSPAPLACTKVIRPVVRHLWELGFRIMAYVDDFGGAPPTPPDLPATTAQAIAGYHLVERLFGELGLKLHPTKGVNTGPTRMRLLGHLIYTRLGLFVLPDDRVDKLMRLARDLSRRAAAHRRWVNFVALRRFCGTAVSTTLSVPAARYHMRSLFTALSFRHPSSGDVRLGRQARPDLNWWLNLRAHAATGRPIWPRSTTMLLETDASSAGWGAVLNRCLYELCAEMGVDLRVEHVSSILNDWADRLSREHDSTDLTLRAAAFRRLDNLYGPHSIDLFATSENTRCLRFYTRWLCPGALGVNVLAHDWAAENAWANPPFHLLGPVVNKIARSSATLTLIAPEWRAFPWWHKAQDHCLEWWRLPPRDGVYTHGSRSTCAPRPFWRTVVFRFGPTRPSATTTTAGSC